MITDLKVPVLQGTLYLHFIYRYLAERVMLHFAGMDAPALLIHDSFIRHHAYGESGEVEEAMRRAFYEEVGEHISKIDKKILNWTYRKDENDTDNSTTLEFDTPLSADDDVSQWRDRHQLWYAQRQYMNDAKIVSCLASVLPVNISPSYTARA